MKRSNIRVVLWSLYLVGMGPLITFTDDTLMRGIVAVPLGVLAMVYYLSDRTSLRLADLQREALDIQGARIEGYRAATKRLENTIEIQSEVIDGLYDIVFDLPTDDNAVTKEHVDNNGGTSNE